VLIAQRALPHICQLDGALGTCIHEPVATDRMEFRSSYDFSQLFHVCWFDVYNVEALILDVQIPKINSKVVAADESLAITVD
jgi:hypothetical protein